MRPELPLQIFQNTGSSAALFAATCSLPLHVPCLFVARFAHGCLGIRLYLFLLLLLLLLLLLPFLPLRQLPPKLLQQHSPW
jgi:hypothetical protein